MSTSQNYGSTRKSHSPIPPHIRPSISRNVSSSSSSSSRQPYHQQREYIPSTLDAGMASDAAQSGLNQRWAYEQAENLDGEGGVSGEGDNEDGEHPDQQQGDDRGETDSQADWDAMRERDHASRPKWRRPSPRWLYPFVSGATLALGMGVAPRAELYINLACLAHPPQAPNTVALSTPSSTALQIPLVMPYNGHYTIDTAPLQAWAEADARTPELNFNATIPYDTPLSIEYDEISPADRWFYKLQHDIYEYKRAHRSSSGPSGSGSSTVDRPAPTGPLPHAPNPSESVPGSSPTERPRPPASEPSNGDDGAGSEADPPYRQIDPKACKRDPKVQAAAAKLLMTMSVTTGILSALTTGYWGQMSDRLGRTKMMAMVEAGLLINEICFITVATFPYAVPGGYKALLVGPTIEGFLGGISTLTATVNAYVSDTTPNGSRASVFARIGGIFMLGFAFGPMLGSAVIQATGNIMTPFYLNVALHLCYFTMILLVLPESLSAEARGVLRKTAKLAKDARKHRDALEREWENETPALADAERPDPFLSAGANAGHSAPARASAPPAWQRRFSISANETSTKREKRMRGYIRRAFRKSTAFLQPLAVFMPTQKEDGVWDWNMTATGAALFMMAILFGVYQIKSAYTQYAFGWTSAQLGPYLSFIGFARGFTMLVILPLAMKIAKPYFVTPLPVTTPSPDRGFSTPRETDALIAAPKAKVKVSRPASLDLWTARISLLLEASLYLILATGLPEIPFIALTGLLTLSSGSGPAVNSLALSFMPNSKEAGKLFGGVAVLHALGSTLLGPLAFGTLFSTTVGTYAPAVWALAGSVQVVSLIMMCLVRIPAPKEAHGGTVERAGSSPPARK